jgi:tRNA uridine 5-carboxymethylaminomethyl modification enzyme
MRKGAALGLVASNSLARLEAKESLIDAIGGFLRQASATPTDVNPFLQEAGTDPITSPDRLLRLVRRAEVRLDRLLDIPSLCDHPFVRQKRGISDERVWREAVEQVDIETKYEGYVSRQREQIERFDRFENDQIPPDLDYARINSLSSEGREKLAKVKPSSIGQASRISGVTSSDVSVLMVMLKG